MNNVILDIAKRAIRDSFNDTSSIDKEALLKAHPELSEPKATFVTLTLHGQLRGCIGSLIAHRSLLEDLIYNAKAAAFEDPRFYPLSEDEFKHTHVEVSLLSEPQPILYDSISDLKTKVKVGEDGTILQQGNRKATFLPQVWEQLPSFELFFSHLCQKAGLESNCLDHHPEIWCYKVKKVK